MPARLKLCNILSPQKNKKQTTLQEHLFVPKTARFEYDAYQKKNDIYKDLKKFKTDLNPIDE